jgi:hypothetical protein
VVHEREGAPGGHLRDLAWLPTRGSWLHAVEDLVTALETAGGAIRLRSEPSVAEIAADPPDVVLVATGADWEATGRSSRRPGRCPLPVGADDAVLGLGAALARAREDPRSLGRRVLIADEAGTYAPLGLAEALALAGAEVEVATPDAAMGASLALRLELPHLLPRLGRLGVTLTVGHHLAAVDPGEVVLEEVWSGRTRRLERVDTVVLAFERRPRDELLEPLRGAVADVRAIGDSRSPRPTAAVIHEAEAVARGL